MNTNVTDNMILNVTDSNVISTLKYAEVWYIINGIGGTILAVFGILGNILAAIVLLLPTMRNSTSILLAVLAVYDILILTLNIFLNTLLSVFLTSVDYLSTQEFVLKYFSGVAHLAYTGTAYMTVLVTMERAIVVLFPLHAKHMCTKPRACIASLVVLMWSVVYSIPRFMEYVEETDNDMKLTEYSVKKSNFGKSYFFSAVYLVYLNALFHFIIPVGVIIILNVGMIQRLCTRETRSIRTVSLRGGNETRLTIMIIIVTIIFCVSQLTAALDLILYPAKKLNGIGLEEFGNYGETCSLICNVYCALAETSPVLNSASNFVVYSIVGRKFRQCLKNLCCYFSCYKRHHRYRNVPEILVHTISQPCNDCHSRQSTERLPSYIDDVKQ